MNRFLAGFVIGLAAYYAGGPLLFGCVVIVFALAALIPPPQRPSKPTRTARPLAKRKIPPARIQPARIAPMPPIATLFR